MTSQSDFDPQNHTTWLSINLRKFDTLEDLRDALENAPEQVIDVEGGTITQDFLLPTLKNLIDMAHQGLDYEKAYESGRLNQLPTKDEHKNFAQGVRRLYNATLERSSREHDEEN